jgi:hypothetical protein
MRSTESILEEYRGADLEKRLNLFLECPSLRTRFTKIDQSEGKEESQDLGSAERDTVA